MTDNSKTLGTIVAYLGEVKDSSQPVCAFDDDGKPIETWLLCDGGAINRDDYKDFCVLLADRLGLAWFGEGHGGGDSTFGLPDLRGYFIRGVPSDAGGRQPYSSRANATIGSTQEAQLGSHAHDISPCIPLSQLGTDATFGQYDHTNTVRESWSAPISTTPAGGDDIYPRNMAVNFLIRVA
jgi:microcystin-dependent protein